MAQEPLSAGKCEACSIDTPPMKGPIVQDLLGQLDPHWKLVDETHIERLFRFKDFQKALDFVNAVGGIAEEEGHHPDVELGWGRAKIILMTHKIKGLSRNDFIMAAKIDLLDL